MIVALHRVQLDDKYMRAARTCDAAAELLDRAGWLFSLADSAGVALQKHHSAERARMTLYVELDAWQEAAYRGVMP